ncbi:phosphatase PAP2 family protein [Aquimarina aggregata]|uniref:phosphatase PAP2 family protein n=1 Tax=Aquimarina aggregata TaxID=1642818 RepID=UPI00248FF117|nr:phosphatase PAP2 family protein [Aquimarina aggregata]
MKHSKNQAFTIALIIVLLLNTFFSYGQRVTEQSNQNYVITSIHDIENVQKHYAELQTLDDTPRPQFAWMDTIAYPPELYKNNTLLFALVKPEYLNSEQVDYLVKSVKFPANSSEQTRTELDYLLKLQQSRTEKQIERVLFLAKIGYWPDANYVSSHKYYKKNLENLFFELHEVIGNEVSAENYPHTSKLLQGVMNDMRLMEFAVKYNLLRARPYQLESKLEPLKKINSPSFTSGHTLWAYIQAYTLAELIPEKRQDFIDLAYEIGESREIMGVHYPSDEEVARQLAHRMLMLMWHTDKFQRDFINAGTEWE